MKTRNNCMFTKYLWDRVAVSYYACNIKGKEFEYLMDNYAYNNRKKCAMILQMTSQSQCYNHICIYHICKNLQKYFSCVK